MADQFEQIHVLDSATWPVLHADSAGNIRRANAAAADFFGPKIEGDATPLTNIWATENDVTPAAFLERVKVSKALTTTLKLRGKGIAITPFNASVCVLGEGAAKSFLFQLFPPNGAPAGGARAADGKAQSVEINLAQKQKLDCALQLTRTVALDFNNTLTAILGHTTHLLATADT